MKKFLTVVLFSLFFLPAIVPNTSIRIDNILILLYGSAILLLGDFKISNIHLNIFSSYKFLFFCILFPLILQSIFIRNAYDIYFLNFQGFFRIFLVIITFSSFIFNTNKIYFFIKLILLGIIYNGIISLIQSFDIQPFSNLINFIYRGDSEARVGSAGGRALGIFTEVHNQAYFQLYSIIFLISLNSIKKIRHQYLFKISLFLSFICLVFSYSRSAWLTFVIVFIFLNLKIFLSKNFILTFIPLLLILFLFYSFLFSEIVKIQILAYFDSILEGAKYIFNPNNDFDDEKVGFITQRLNWGWLNAITVWSDNKVFGDISYGSRHGLFIGDGGYTEILANHGTIGFLGLIYFIFNIRKSEKKLVKSKLYFKAMTLTFFFGAFAVGIFRERSMEILPIYMMIITKYEFDNQ